VPGGPSGSSTFGLGFGLGTFGAGGGTYDRNKNVESDPRSCPIRDFGVKESGFPSEEQTVYSETPNSAVTFAIIFSKSVAFEREYSFVVPL
jgi:hypothetical protein